MGEVAIRLHLELLDEGGYVATSPDVPGLVAEGRSITEAVEIAQGLARKIAESCIEHGDPLPPALAALSDPDGRVGHARQRQRPRDRVRRAPGHAARRLPLYGRTSERAVAQDSRSPRRYLR